MYRIPYRYAILTNQSLHKNRGARIMANKRIKKKRAKSQGLQELETPKGQDIYIGSVYGDVSQDMLQSANRELKTFAGYMNFFGRIPLQGLTKDEVAWIARGNLMNELDERILPYADMGIVRMQAMIQDSVSKFVGKRPKSIKGILNGLRKLQDWLKTNSHRYYKHSNKKANPFTLLYYDVFEN